MKKCVPVIGMLMKMSLCIVVVVCSTTLTLLAKHTEAQLLEKRITLKVEGGALHDALDEIGASANLSFSYAVNKEIFNSIVTIRAKHQKVGNVLKDLLAPFSLEYFIADDKVIIRRSNEMLANMLLDADAGLMYKDIRGKVVNEKDDPLPGVSIRVKDASMATVTDEKGEYLLKGIPENAILVVSFMGYNTQEIASGKDTQLRIVLTEDTKKLGEIVVVGYGSQKRASLTSAVSSVKGAAVAERPVPNVVNALQGQVPGLFIQQTDGMPGTNNNKLNIRGISTLSSNPVLVLIDGVAGQLETVNPQDIDNISILKDASATAIYGARASGGVILVTTRKGKLNSKPSLAYDAYAGIQQPTYLPKLVDAVSFMRKWNESQLNDNPDATVRFSDANIQQYASGELPSTDWISAIFKENALQMQHNVGISGGTKNTDYFVSLGYLKQEGLVEGVMNERFTSRVNVNTQILDNLKFGINTVYMNAPKSFAGAGIYTTAMHWAYILNPTEWAYTPQGRDRSYRGGSQPVAIINHGGFENYKDNYFNTNLTLDYGIAKNLSVKGQYSYNTRDIKHKIFRATYKLYDDEENLVTTQQSPNSLNDDYNTTINQTFIGTLNYGLQVKQHDFKALLGYSQESLKYDSYSLGRQDFLNNDIHVINGGSMEKDQWTTGGGAYEWAIQSMFGRLSYSFKDRYLLEVNGRYDGSSRFKNNRWGFFPSVSAGWRISEEDFLKGSDIVSNLKLRGSYGKVGNQNATGTDTRGIYSWASLIGTGASYFNDKAQTTTYYNNTANPDLTWEEKVTGNIGVDAGFLDEKITLTADVFKEKTTGILLTPSVPSTFGRDAPVMNLGRMSNWGWEVSAGYQNRDNKLKYGVMVNIYDSRNKILDLGGTPDVLQENPVMVGQSRWTWYGYKALGLYQSDEEVKASPTYKPQNKAGDIKYQDTNGDGKITPEDRVILGDADPHVMFGVNANFSWKQFDLSMLFQGVLKNKTYLTGYAVSPFNYGGSFTTDLMDSWTPENKGARYPLMRQDLSVNYDLSDWWLYDSKYVRLKNLQLGYNVPTHILQRAKIGQLRFYFMMENALTLKSKRFPKNFDPEIDNWQSGVNFPQMKTYTFGLNLKF
ncbi:SusC/RagA family TonB-linked outer membrane protein [Chitinophaga sp. ARDCPP14]|uniref:SusC/RagA family TonB-linked outer membrane protein n=1 Tax=Chitinophaga sp. ARDCPP14 TaxID=3391139 RepID=UPI003F5254E2